MFSKGVVGILLDSSNFPKCKISYALGFVCRDGACGHALQRPCVAPTQLLPDVKGRFFAYMFRLMPLPIHVTS